MRLINPEIRFEVTNKCNASCIMCPREKMRRPQGIMDLGIYKKILDEALEAGVKQVTLENYGESFLDPYIFERSRYARAKGLTVYTVTNASLLDNEKCEQAAESFDKIRVSMYGMTKDTYERIHKGLCFKEVRENVDRLFRIRDRKRSRLKIEMYFLLLEENRREMKGFISAYENIADAISVWKPHNWADGRRYRQPLPVKKATCARPASGPVQIQWDGLVVPCCFDYDSKMVLGDLKAETLSEALDSDEYNALRRAHKTGDFSKYPLCDICDQLYKREDVLVYSSIKDIKVGSTYAAKFKLGSGKGDGKE